MARNGLNDGTMRSNAKEPATGDPASPAGEIVLYQTEDGRLRVECRFVDETLWLSQPLIAELFQKDIRTVNEHLQNLYAEGEIEAQATIRKFRIVRREGSREVAREIEHYNSDAILVWATACAQNVEPSSAAGQRSA